MTDPFFTSKFAQQAGTTAYNVRQQAQKERLQQRDQSRIGSILQKYNDPSNPLSYNQAMNEILMSISPENQTSYMNALGAQEKQRQEQFQRSRTAAALQSQGLDPTLADLDPQVLKQIYQQKQLKEILGPSESLNTQQPIENVDYRTSVSPESPDITGLRNQLIPDEKIAQVNAINPSLGAQLQKKNENIQNRIQRLEDQRYKRFTDERDYHTKFSQKQEEKVNDVEESLLKNKAARDLARNAFESEDLSFFSWDNIANKTGLENLRTAKGAQLTLAAKDSLLNNLSKVTSRGQNLWMEKRMSSMFPQVGQNLEANQTFDAMLEGEALLDEAYVNAFNKFKSEDEEKYGYVRKDVHDRARAFRKSVANKILKRTAYRTKVIEENALLNKGLSKLKADVGKHVVPGTILTVAMGSLYHDKYGENYKKVAKSHGYEVPNDEEIFDYLKDYDEYVGLF